MRALARHCRYRPRGVSWGSASFQKSEVNFFRLPLTISHSPIFQGDQEDNKVSNKENSEGPFRKMVQALSFLAPSLHPNTLTDIALPLPSSSSSAPPRDAIVKHLAIKHGSHQPVGLVKHMISRSEDSTLVSYIPGTAA